MNSPSNRIVQNLFSLPMLILVVFFMAPDFSDAQSTGEFPVGLITRGRFESPDDYEGTFRVLGKNNVIPLELGERISGSVALRNRMVHGYETVQRKRMLDDISGGINQYAEYMKHISAFVEKQNK